jgi:hypothetical protein
MTSMISHGHKIYQFTHYKLNIYMSGSTHTVGSIAKLLRDLESPPKHLSRQIFVVVRSAPLFEALLKGTYMCEGSLPPPPESLVSAARLLLVLIIQLDNVCGNNKNQYVCSFCLFLVQKRVFYVVHINFLIGGHTHDKIKRSIGGARN